MEWMDRPRLIGGLGWVAVGVVLQAVYWFTGGAAGGITVLDKAPSQRRPVALPLKG